MYPSGTYETYVILSLSGTNPNMKSGYHHQIGMDQWTTYMALYGAIFKMAASEVKLPLVLSINQSIYFVICTCRHNLHKDNFHLLMYNITGTQLTFEGCNFHIGCTLKCAELRLIYIYVQVKALSPLKWQTNKNAKHVICTMKFIHWPSDRAGPLLFFMHYNNEGLTL